MSAPTAETDPFDRLYERWADHALGKRMDPPSREQWDEVMLRLVLSDDPERVRRYRRMEAQGPETLGADAYDLWQSVPDYTQGRSMALRTRAELRAYEQAHLGSMRRLMEARGLGERYREMLAAYEEVRKADRARATRAQTQVVIIGCAGMGFILLMVLTVLLIIAIQMSG